MKEIEKLYSLYIAGAKICTDTRNIIDGCIFFALKGANFNGNKFASQALKNGAIAVVADEPTGMDNNNIIYVDDALTTLQQFASYHRSQLNIPFIAITGSNGKTTTKELLNRVLSEKMKVQYTKGNLNNHIGVPLTLLTVTKDHEAAIIEMGANHQQEIKLLCDIAKPTHVLITNVGKAHLEGFGGIEGVMKGKGEMYDFAKLNSSQVFINDDSKDLKIMLGTYYNIFTYGSDISCDLQGKIIPSEKYVSIDWKAKNSSGWNSLNSRLPGIYNYENILSAIAVGKYFGVEDSSIENAITSYIPDNQRSQEIVKGTNNIILDAYNANPTSMSAAIENFNSTYKNNRAVFLGDMFELGESSGKEHEAIAQLTDQFNFDKIILVGPEFKKTAAIKNGIYFSSSAEAREWLILNPLSNYNILIKGSRSSKMEVVMEGIK